MDAADCLVPSLARRAAEAVAVLALTTKHAPLGVGLVGMGAIDNAPASVAQVLRFALVANARALIVTNNHPSGDPEPSREDWALTEHMVAAAAFLDFDLVDHLILVESGPFCSLRAADEERFLAPLGGDRDRQAAERNRVYRVDRSNPAAYAATDDAALPLPARPARVGALGEDRSGYGPGSTPLV